MRIPLIVLVSFLSVSAALASDDWHTVVNDPVGAAVCYDQTKSVVIPCPDSVYWKTHLFYEAPPARRHVEKSTVKDIGAGEIQIELIKGINSEVVIMSREKAKELWYGLGQKLIYEITRDGYRSLSSTTTEASEPRIYKYAKPAAR